MGNYLLIFEIINMEVIVNDILRITKVGPKEERIPIINIIDYNI